jgi:lysozyme family protein
MRDCTAAYYADLFDGLEVLRERQREVFQKAVAVLDGRAVYERVGDALGIPWVFVGLLHLMEADCDFDRQILNGERWDRVTTLEPVGRGPFASWGDSAGKALIGFVGILDWPITAIARRLEEWNGMGYANRDKASPYLVAGSTSGIGVGKFVADGKYDPRATSQQIGALVVLREIVSRGEWAEEREDLFPLVFGSRDDGDGGPVAALQTTLNHLHRAYEAPGPLLAVDGIYGAQTRAAVKAVIQ